MPSHPVPPIPAPKLDPETPRSAPLTVRLPPPVVAWFARATPVIHPTSYVPASDTVPVIDPAVTTARTLPPSPDDALHDTELSDTHPVPSHLVPPAPAPTLYPAAPRSLPLTVTLPCPVVPTFTSPTPDTVPASYDPSPVIVLDKSPAVTYVVTLPPTPDPARHTTTLSDSHNVPAHRESPNRTATLYDAVPRSPPLTVTLPCPLLATFPEATVPASSKLKPSVTVPPASPAVTTTRTLPPRPDPTLHVTELSDTHPVPSHPVCPAPTPTLYPELPMSAPLTVRLPCPVVAWFDRPPNTNRPPSYVPASLTLPTTDPTLNTA